MHIQVSDVVSFGSLVFAFLAYMKVRKKIVFWVLITISITALFVSVFSRSESPSPQVKQSAIASGTATINQAGRDINTGISESTMLMLLREKAIARDRELAQKYPLGCVLLGVLSDGKVIYQPNSRSLKLDPDNDVIITIDAATKVAYVDIKSFRFESNPNGKWGLVNFTLQVQYVENRPEPLPFGSWGCVSAIDSKGRTMWIVDAHRDNGRKFVVRSDEKLTAFLELERITHELALLALLGNDRN